MNPYILIFRGKLRRFEIILKNFFLYICENINISRKRTLFWDLFEKLVYVHIFVNISISEKITLFVNINISRKRKILFWDHFESRFLNFFVAKISKVKENVLFIKIQWKNTTFRSKHIILKTILKLHFCPYIQKYQHFEKTNVILR